MLAKKLLFLFLCLCLLPSNLIAQTITTVNIHNGGTGATTAAGAWANLFTGAGIAANCPVLATASNGAITCSSFTGGGGGGSSYPSLNAKYVFTGSSINDDDAETQATPVVISSFATAGSGVIIFTNSGANNFRVGDWVNTRYLTSGVWPAAPANLAIGTGYTLFQVMSVGLSSTQFEINVGSLPVVACSASCGTVASAMNNLPYVTTTQPGMPVEALANTSMILPADVTIRGLASTYTALFHQISPAVTGNPGYLIISDPWNDITVCRSVSQIEADYSSVFAQAHTDGWTVMVSTPYQKNAPQQWGIGFCAFPVSPAAEMVQLTRWLEAQGQSTLNRTSGQYWDILDFAGSVYNDPWNTNASYGASSAWQIWGADLATAIKTGSGAPVPLMPIYFGTYQGASANVQNGYWFVPSQDGWAYQFSNANMTSNVLTMVTNTNVYNQQAWFNSTLAVYGASGPFFSPVLSIVDTPVGTIGGGYLNSAVKSMLLLNNFTPSTDTSKNNIIFEYSTDPFQAQHAPAQTNGHQVDLGFNYNSTSNPALNSYFAHMVGDLYDAFHVSANGTFCVGLLTVTASSGTAGCPTTNQFSVGTTGQMFVDNAGNTTVHNLTINGTCTGSGCGSGGSGGSDLTQIGGTGSDASTPVGNGIQPLTLNSVNSTPGTCGDSTHVGQLTVNAKGLTTSCTPVSIASTGGGGSSSYSGTPNQVVATSPIPAGSLRGTAMISASGTSGTITLPVGSQVGDACYLIYGSNAQLDTSTAGWSAVHSDTGSYWGGWVQYKVLTSSDIVAGSITLSYHVSVGIEASVIVLKGSSYTFREVDVLRDGGDAFASPVAGPSTTTSVAANDAIFYFAGVPGSPAVTVDRGTQLQTNSGDVLAVEYASSGGSVTPNFTYSSTSGNSYYQIALVLEGMSNPSPTAATVRPLVPNDLPLATPTSVGAVKTDNTTTTVDADGTLHAYPAWVVDDFISGTSSSMLGWSLSASGGGLVHTTSTSFVGHNGVQFLSASGNNNTYAVYGLPINSVDTHGQFYAATGESFAIASSVAGDIVTGGPVTFGFGDTPGASGSNGMGAGGPNPPNFAGFLCYPVNNGGSSDWFAQVVNGGTSTSNVDTGVSCLGWHTLEISVTGTTSTFYVDGISTSTAAINSTNYTPFYTAWSQPSGSGSAQMYIDWFAEKLTTVSGLI